MTKSFNIGPENYEVFSDAEIVWMGAAIVTPDNVTYIPYATEDGQVGYVVQSNEGNLSEFIYLNASTSTDDGRANVFLYQGESGEASYDGAVHHYLVAESFTGPVVDEPVVFGAVALEPFSFDLNGEWPADTRPLHELEDGDCFTDAQDRVYTRIGHGPAQGSVEIANEENIHAYWDVLTRIKPHP